jgi:hypothetical protein
MIDRQTDGRTDGRDSERGVQTGRAMLVTAARFYKVCSVTGRLAD